MSSVETPASDRYTTVSRHPETSWLWAICFAAVGFLAGGSTVFYLGYRALSPPPPSPGTGLCSNGILGGLFIMVVGTPLAAIVCSVLAGVIGGGLAHIFDHYRQRPRDSDATPRVASRD